MSAQVTPHPLKAAIANRNFRLLWIGASISVLGSQFSLIALPWLVLQLSDPQTLGLALALAGLSRAVFMLIGGAVTNRISPRKILLAAFGWIESTWLDFALMLGLGVENGYISLVIFTRIQQSTPREMLGRVMSMMLLSSMGLVPLSQAISGAVGAWNLTALFVLAGGLLVVVAVWLAFNPSLKTLSNEMAAVATAD